MHFTTVTTTLLLAVVTAMPSPTTIDNSLVERAPAPAVAAVSGELQGTANSGAEAAELSAMAQKAWQAAGGCKRDWDEDRRCVNQCIGEANSKCPRWRSMAGVLTGGCVIGWKTCECVCEY